MLFQNYDTVNQGYSVNLTSCLLASITKKLFKYPKSPITLIIEVAQIQERHFQLCLLKTCVNLMRIHPCQVRQIPCNLNVKRTLEMYLQRFCVARSESVNEGNNRSMQRQPRQNMIFCSWTLLLWTGVKWHTATKARNLPSIRIKVILRWVPQRLHVPLLKMGAISDTLHYNEMQCSFQISRDKGVSGCSLSFHFLVVECLTVLTVLFRLTLQIIHTCSDEINHITYHLI